MSYIPGDWWVICDQCGRRTRSSKVTKRWDGLLVHKDPNQGCYETRHPQDFVRPVKDNYPLPFTRTEPPDVEVAFTVHTIIENAPWNTVPTGTFEGTDYDV
jgi:hypothetical protein